MPKGNSHYPKFAAEMTEKYVKWMIEENHIYADKWEKHASVWELLYPHLFGEEEESEEAPEEADEEDSAPPLTLSEEEKLFRGDKPGKDGAAVAEA
jgi:hypothetical protein